MSDYKASQHERIRCQVYRLRGIADSLERAILLPGPIGNEVSTAVVLIGHELAVTIAKHDYAETPDDLTKGAAK